MTEVARAGIEVEVVKAVRAPVRPSFVRGLLMRAATLPEVQARLPAAKATVAVRLTDDDELRRLNRDYAEHDAATDVLSFAGEHPNLGDLAVSWPMAVRQAEEFGHTAETELALLCVHGFLHLLGWDHASASERVEMTRLTVAALGLSGLQLASSRL